MDVIITSPHHCLPNIFDLGCDKNSKIYADVIAYILSSRHQIIRLSNTTPRFVCDPNRLPCRNLPFRQQLTIRLKYMPSVVLDIHTFPCQYFGEDIDFMLLCGTYPEYKDMTPAMALLEYIRRYKIDRVGTGCSPINDIIVESDSLKVPAVLLEIRDDFDPFTDHRIYSLCEALSDWIDDYAKLKVQSPLE